MKIEIDQFDEDAYFYIGAFLIVIIVSLGLIVFSLPIELAEWVLPFGACGVGFGVIAFWLLMLYYYHLGEYRRESK